MNRFFDIAFSLFILMIFFPFGMIVALLIICDDFGPVFYGQERIGKNQIPFLLFKFRSMKVKQTNTSLITVGAKDPRITRIGYFIRRFKIDEFPQFLNVLIGNMAVVGPRPEVKKYVDLYSEEQKNVLRVRPGITDRASLEYFEENRLLGESNDPEEMYTQTIMPAKLAINLKYIPKQGLKESITVVFLTAKRIFISK